MCKCTNLNDSSTTPLATSLVKKTSLIAKVGLVAAVGAGYYGFTKGKKRRGKK